jgi:peptidoglycan/xylan/chitin deacetylase (PgdA/CDA1 family)
MRPDAFACFTFDNMAEAADVGAGVMSAPLTDPPHVSLALGFPRIHALLERHGIRATFFVEGWNGRYHSQAVAEIARRGHEVGMHGWVHEQWHQLAPDEEARLAREATLALAHAAGVRPRGFRAPGGQRSAETTEILRELGYQYDASLGDGMRPGLLAPDLAQVPFVWPGVDGYYYLRPQPTPPAVVLDGWLRTLDRVAAQGGLFLLICHAFITGIDDERLTVLDEVMRAAVSDPRIRITTAGEVAAGMLTPK